MVFMTLMKWSRLSPTQEADIWTRWKAGQTSTDFGSLPVNSPQITLSEDGRLKGVSAGQCAGYDEWYVFESPHDLGALCDGNVFESDLPAGKIWTFVNYDDGFALHNPGMSDLTSLFWKQLEWIQPESFIADSGAFLTFVTRNESIFAAACNALKDLSDNS